MRILGYECLRLVEKAQACVSVVKFEQRPETALSLGNPARHPHPYSQAALPVESRGRSVEVYPELHLLSSSSGNFDIFRRIACQTFCHAVFIRFPSFESFPAVLRPATSHQECQSQAVTRDDREKFSALNVRPSRSWTCVEFLLISWLRTVKPAASDVVVEELCS